MDPDEQPPRSVDVRPGSRLANIWADLARDVGAAAATTDAGDTLGRLRSLDRLVARRLLDQGRLAAAELQEYLRDEQGAAVSSLGVLQRLVRDRKLQPEEIARWIREEPTHSQADRSEQDPRFGRYVRIGDLGAGGMGDVLLARDQILGRTLALKVVNQQHPDLLRRFLREAQISGKLDHPNIVPVYDFGVAEDGRPFLAMRRIVGTDLHRELKQLDRAEHDRELPRLLRLFVRICDAVAHAHSRGVIHRDLKPANVMVGEFGEVLVMDWGLARHVDWPDTPPPERPPLSPAPDLSLTQEGQVVGTPAYMAPEQALGKLDLDERCDVYALGAILYEILTRHPPYEGRDFQQLRAQVIRGNLTPPSSCRPGLRVDPGLEAIVLRAMATERSERYHSATALRDEVLAHLDGRAVRAQQETPLQTLARVTRRHPLATATTALVLAILVTGTAVSVSFRSKARVGAARARQEAAKTRRSWKATEEAARRAEREQLEFASLADALRIDQLLQRSARLGPQSWKIPKMERWLWQTEGLISGRPAHLRVVTRLAGIAQPSAVQRWRLERTRSLLGKLRTLGALRRQIAGYLAAARAAASRDLRLTDSRWRKALIDIQENPPYRMRIPAQEGLIPLGKDPRTGLWEFLHLPTGRAPRPREGGGWRVEPETGVVLVLLPGGRFRMGAHPADETNADPDATPLEAPVHQVALRPFFISKYELTIAQWKRLGGKLPATVTKLSATLPMDTKPIFDVAAQASERALGQVGLRLPTEAQWEYAARGGTTTPWWQGRSRADLTGRANLGGRELGARSREPAHVDPFPFHAPVGSLGPNPFGLHHVLGNVMEMCEDRFLFDAYRVPVIDQDGRREPRPAGTGGRVLRGGSFMSSAPMGRVSLRVEATRPSLLAGVRPARRLQR